MMKLKRWNESYWCDKCRVNVHKGDTMPDVTGTIANVDCELYELCPSCRQPLNFWGYGSYETPETKSGRLKHNFIMQLSLHRLMLRISLVCFVVAAVAAGVMWWGW